MKNKIVVHCSATRPSMDIGAHEIDEWHKARGWNGIGYNAVIRRDGTLEPGRDLDGDGDWAEETGAHSIGFNTNSIGICLIGGVDEENHPSANFTSAQYVTLYTVVNDLRAELGINDVVGHCDLPGVYKACPCFDVRAFFS